MRTCESTWHPSACRRRKPGPEEGCREASSVSGPSHHPSEWAVVCLSAAVMLTDGSRNHPSHFVTLAVLETKSLPSAARVVAFLQDRRQDLLQARLPLLLHLLHNRLLREVHPGRRLRSRRSYRRGSGPTTSDPLARSPDPKGPVEPGFQGLKVLSGFRTCFCTMLKGPNVRGCTVSDHSKRGKDCTDNRAPALGFKT